jgi:RimJ/RimL family protein N-acetyltransferase
METPDFSFLTLEKVERYSSNQKYTLIPVRDIEINQSHYESIFNICNENEIYKWLFSPGEYTIDKAKGFLSWSKEGWKSGTHFVFLILTESNEIAGAMDIKSSDINAGEVGYWISSNHTGLASNSLGVLKSIAKQAGYKKLFAQTKNGNNKSENVLLRNKFIENKEYHRDSACSKAFVIEFV